MSNEILSGCAFLGLSFVILFGLRWYRLDAYRQRLFDLRDDLFNYALSGRISFQDPRYRDLRLRINSLIRYAHTATFISFVCGTVFAKKQKKKEAIGEAVSLWMEPLDRAGKEIRRLHFQLAMFTLLKILYLPFSLEERILKAFDNGQPPARRFVSDSMESIEKHAIDTRVRHLAACESQM